MKTNWFFRLPLSVALLLMALNIATTAHAQVRPPATPAQYQQAFDQFLPLAEQGDVNAQTFIGLAYLNGNGAKQDYTQALHWLVLAAEQGYAEAQFGAGMMYVIGLGMEKNDRNEMTGILWLMKAAEQGHEEAQAVFKVDNGANIISD